ncbi:hypothetical protein COT42_08700 [Candidatus Saganbacteria bacterium CG08_land_8_20_14_0_20_45_16]|uniref:Uncharacterized protein n=1 Tax=Candidatus Saganbacteria bacterium CG08_land_8_20_14_0_20_45_16 TaxID=2014293 RepID=A0A2H0XTG8_UNCSA|nr:MAG: hypothetical protein COT42_08700 [Candidatus Saganbacteria bacterium CG08_land_8_20_14_0_20_45_16]
MYTRDFLFYFNKTTADWQDFPPREELRAYITLKPEQIDGYFRIFVDLCDYLYAAGVDFTAKAASRLGFLERVDNMVFYIAGYNQLMAEAAIKQFLRVKNIGVGHVPLARPSDQEGLSWANEPDDRQVKIWQEISGSSKQVSYMMFEAIQVVPHLLARISNAHALTGNIQQKRVFSEEADRTKSVLTKISRPTDTW